MPPLRTPLVWLVMVTLIALHALPLLAQNNKGGGKGGGGGGGGESEPPAFQVVTLAEQTGSVIAMNDTRQGVVELVGRAGDQPTYWVVTYQAGQVSQFSTPLLGLDSSSVYPRDINNDGIIVGLEGASLTTPLLWRSGLEAPISLPIPDLFVIGPEADEVARAEGISDDGLIVGVVSPRPDPDTGELPFDEHYVIVWRYDPDARDVSNRHDPQEGRDYLLFPVSADPNPSISRRNGYLAFTSREEGQQRAVRLQVAWDDAEESLYVDQDPALLLPGNAYTSGVNDDGIVVGRQSQRDAWGNFGYAIDLNGNLHYIPTLPSFRYYGTLCHYHVHYARSVNSVNNGQEVLTLQWASNSSGSLFQPRDVVSVLDGTSAIDLRTYSPNWEVWSARAINHQGWIAGQVNDGAGNRPPALIIR
jgi:hypothetical protein